MQTIQKFLIPIVSVIVAFLAAWLTPANLVHFGGLTIQQIVDWLTGNLMVSGGIGTLIVTYVIAKLPVPDYIQQAITGVVFTSIANAVTVLTGFIPANFVPMPVWIMLFTLVGTAVQFLIAKFVVYNMPERLNLSNPEGFETKKTRALVALGA